MVLALGNPAPRPLEAARERYHNTPWENGALTGLHPKATVLLLGAGLTAVDAFLALDALGHQGDIYCLSRRGKLPHVHTVYQAPEEPFAPLGINSARCLLRELRREVEEAQRRGYDWRGVVDSLRPITNEIWEDFSLREKSRVFRHLKTWWDIHRHRMAPEIGAKLNSALACRRLRVVAGRLKRITPEKDNLRVEITQRSQAGISLLADRLINCTGSEEDYQRSPNLLVRSLLESGRIRSNPTGKGLWTDADGALIDSKGVVSDWLFTLGPPRTGGLFETTAVPEVRIQAEALAHRLVSTRIRRRRYRSNTMWLLAYEESASKPMIGSMSWGRMSPDSFDDRLVHALRCKVPRFHDLATACGSHRLIAGGRSLMACCGVAGLDLPTSVYGHLTI